MHVVFVGIASKVHVFTFNAGVKFTDVGRVVGRTIKLKHDYWEFVVCFSFSTEFWVSQNYTEHRQSKTFLYKRNDYFGQLLTLV